MLSLNQKEFKRSKLSLRKYAIDDLIISPSQLKVLFVLESPHKDEFIHLHPVAGSTGEKLSYLFKSQGFLNTFNQKDPIGCQIKKLNYPYLGIMESSNLPMDKSFYPCFLSRGDCKFIQNISYAKTKLERRIQKNYIPNGIVEKYLVKDFSTRLSSLQQSNSGIIIISFGHISANFLNVARVNHFNLPHPTGRNWSNASAMLNSFSLNPLLLP